MVLNSPDGEWLAEHFNLPINIHGNVKQGNFILYSAVPLAVNGTYSDPTLRFLPSALLRMTGKERFLTIDDLRFPLAGIRVDKNGINGRLQTMIIERRIGERKLLRLTPLQLEMIHLQQRTLLIRKGKMR